jgi:DNA adenine methylase
LSLKNNLIGPVLKWAGGKRQLLDTYEHLFPKDITTYCEPFVGGAAVLFSLQPAVAYINDINYELMRVYRVVKCDVEKLITTLKIFKNDRETFYSVRDWDRNADNYAALSDVMKAARIIYLNKTCFNGLYRVNSSGKFNTPFGNYRNPNIVNESTLRAVSKYLNSADITMTSEDYAGVLEKLPSRSFVYIDPPYDPISNTSNFTGYTKHGFDSREQIRLREQCDDLNRRGIRFMLSNSATNFIKEQYAAYNITVVQAKRTVNSDASKRGGIDEVVIRNYE